MAKAELGLPSSDGPTKPKEDWLTDLPLDYLLPRFAHYVRSGQYPDGKGYDDQPQVLLDDFETLFREYRYRYDQAKKEHKF